MSQLDESPVVGTLLQEIGAAVEADDAQGVCEGVKAALEKNPRSLKTTTSVQEWCGHTFTQLNRIRDGYLVLGLSYFESEGDETINLDLTNLVGPAGATVSIATPDDHQVTITDADTDRRVELIGGNGQRLVTPAHRQDSSMLATLSHCDCLIVRPPEAPPAAAGSAVARRRCSRS